MILCRGLTAVGIDSEKDCILLFQPFYYMKMVLVFHKRRLDNTYKMAFSSIPCSNKS